MKKLSIFLSVLLLAAILGGCKKSVDAEMQAQATVAATELASETPTEAPTEAATQAPATVDASWFDDAVFVGDSITLALDYACADDPSLLGNAKFVCAQSLGYHNALWDLNAEGAVHPTYQGQTILAETAAEVTGATKVFVLLGVNDIGTYGAEDTMEEAKEMARRILSHSPDVKLYFQSTTPMLASAESGWLNNDKITDFDMLLQAYCEENGYGYIDLYHQVCDADGKLIEDYCGDPDVQGIHFNTDGCAIWVNYLKSVVSSYPAAGTSAAAPTEAPASDDGAYADDDSYGDYSYDDYGYDEEDEIVITYSPYDEEEY